MGHPVRLGQGSQRQTVEQGEQLSRILPTALGGAPLELAWRWCFNRLDRAFPERAGRRDEIAAPEQFSTVT